jgi:hypothetical protein
LTQLEASTPQLLPHELRQYKFSYLMPDWCWVVESSGEPIALIVTSQAHGMLFIWRILSTASAKSAANWLLASMPAILDTAKQRGCVSYAAFLHDDRPLEAKLNRIMQRAGALVQPWTGALAVVQLYKDGE